MSVWLAMLIGGCIGVVITTIILSSTRNGRIQAEYEQYIAELELAHKQALVDAQKRSVNTSRAVLKGKMAEQFAPILPEFQYLPSDAKFLGDPVDYVVFDGYTDFRDGDGDAEDIEVILLDIKSGSARLSKGQQAIAQAIREGRVRFETLRIDFNDYSVISKLSFCTRAISIFCAMLGMPSASKYCFSINLNFACCRLRSMSRFRWQPSPIHF